MAGPVHYELYIRKTAPSPWTLMQATENRQQAIEAAEEILRDKHAVAVRVTKETLDPDTMEFNSVTVLTRGAPEAPRKRVVDQADRPNCMTPADLYTPHARDLLGRVLEDWLMRNGVTPFELLHRPDLVERLEASGVEVQHAIQKIAIPESQATGQPVHELIRHYQRLVEQAMERVMTAGRKGTFPDLANRSLADVAHRLAGTADRAFVMGGVIAGALVGVRGARGRLDRLMDLADRAPMEGAPRALVMVGIEQILVELLAARTGLAEILGPALDQGGSLAAVVRMVAPREIDALIAHDPRMALLMPAVDGAAARLGQRLDAGEYPILAASLARMVLRELQGPRRLRPADAPGEIDILRTLAMSLTATAGRLLTLEEVQNAFIERSKSLVTADFVQSYVVSCETVLCEAEQLTRLCENVTGAANKRSAARWLAACVTSLRFESEMRGAGPTAARKLQILAQLQRSVRAAALSDHDTEQIGGAIGVVGGTIEAEAKLTTQLARAPAPIPQKLSALLRLAAGETAPFGPAADRAKAEAIRMFRAPEARASLSASPETLVPLKTLMRAAGLAA
ncbi:hypothetical protein [Brevundimonas subvibrioides]|uniref:Uncharacterized protein n=1 Tax=Brevundimonas subvibrioides (strain ATCC 15264 / DSM 4735 / LMG 14903 / NBRC 16000 / CB 81) TaxID=633149 RepID=D9QJ48_BRESC|nr:hypothetical protein [Brevundimonas subvibrioides]ADK99572.1 conserved hypothetical protein [Brevundimonas subvibrioides ATCC 15264]